MAGPFARLKGMSGEMMALAVYIRSARIELGLTIAANVTEIEWHTAEEYRT